MYPKCLRDLIECFKEFPGIGDKTAERMTFSLIDFDKEKLTEFSDAIISARDNLGRCLVCNNLADGDLCTICKNDSRNHKVIFVVENAKDVMLFEKIGAYNGVYHVLDGLISPLDGIGPNDIKIGQLLDRIEKNDVSEVILALRPNIEGETTMQYIKKLLSNRSIKVSKLASGIPIGTDMEYIDSMTLELAIDERKELS